MAEVEMIATNLKHSEQVRDELFNIELPSIIQNELIFEVTDLDSFSNKQLAIKINNVKTLYEELL